MEHQNTVHNIDKLSEVEEIEGVQVYTYKKSQAIGGEESRKLQRILKSMEPGKAFQYPNKERSTRAMIYNAARLAGVQVSVLKEKPGLLTVVHNGSREDEQKKQPEPQQPVIQQPQPRSFEPLPPAGYQE
jgi:hypothetical protein